MPACAAFVDDLRAAFGADEINSVIKRGLRQECEPALRVYFSEGGHELGQSPSWIGQGVTPVLPMVVAGKRGAR